MWFRWQSSPQRERDADASRAACPGLRRRRGRRHLQRRLPLRTLARMESAAAPPSAVPRPPSMSADSRTDSRRSPMRPLPRRLRHPPGETHSVENATQNIGGDRDRFSHAPGAGRGVAGARFEPRAGSPPGLRTDDAAATARDVRRHMDEAGVERAVSFRSTARPRTAARSSPTSSRLADGARAAADRLRLGRSLPAGRGEDPGARCPRVRAARAEARPGFAALRYRQRRACLPGLRSCVEWAFRC